MSTEMKVDALERILNCGESMRDVHDAVAELIEADGKYDKARAAFDAACKPATHTSISRQPKHGDPVVAAYHAAIARRAAALTRVGGAA